MGKHKGKFVMLVGSCVIIGLGAGYYIAQHKSEEVVGAIETIDQPQRGREIGSSLARFKQGIEPATIIGHKSTREPEMALIFEGMADYDTMISLLNLLEQYEVRGTFFVPGIDSAEDERIVKAIKAGGHDIGSYGLKGTSAMENLSTEQLIEELVLTNEILQGITGEIPDLFKGNSTNYTEELLQALSACGLSSGVRNNRVLNYASFISDEQANGYVQSLPYGSIVSIKLNGVLTDREYQKPKQEKEPVMDQEATIDHLGQEVMASKGKRLLDVVQWLLQAAQGKEYEYVMVKEYTQYGREEQWPVVLPRPQWGGAKKEPIISSTEKPSTSPEVSKPTNDYQQLINQYTGKMADPISWVVTTQKGVSFTFRGISEEQQLADVLDHLAKLGITGTFFITGHEAEQYPQYVQWIKEQGHEIGNGGYTGKNLSNATVEDVCREIEEGRIALQRIGLDTQLFMPAFGVSNEAVSKGAAVMGQQLITYTTAMVKEQYEGRSAEEIVANHFGKQAALHRGAIVYFRMDYLHDQSLIGQLVEEVYRQKVANTAYRGNGDMDNDSVYSVIPVGELLDEQYSYQISPKSEQHLIPKVIDEKEFQQRVEEKYIGSPDISGAEQLPGFQEEERASLDKTGRIDTQGKREIFLSFDDWGSDGIINQILYVLDKHKVKATFFVRTNYVMGNPNLLRAIAEEGHEIASHTDSHGGLDISEEQVQWLREDLMRSELVLNRIVGDTGRLTKMLRPPRLEISRMGLHTAWEVGYEYIVNGDYSTQDYMAESVWEIYDKFVSGMKEPRRTLQPGSIVVMHMSDEAKYTPEALDRFLTENSKKSDDDPTKVYCRTLGEYLEKEDGGR